MVTVAVAMIVHKWVESLALSSMCMRAGARWWQILLVLLPFAVMAFVGVAIGVSVTNSSDWAEMVLFGLISGELAPASHPRHSQDWELNIVVVRDQRQWLQSLQGHPMLSVTSKLARNRCTSPFVVGVWLVCESMVAWLPGASEPVVMCMSQHAWCPVVQLVVLLNCFCPFVVHK